MRRRDFLAVVGGAASWPLATHAQQPAMPVVGFLHGQSPDTNADRLRAFRQGLKDTGFVEGENVAIEYRWAENQLDRLPALADELVRRKVAVIVAGGAQAAVLVAKAVTTTIPIVFITDDDPVRRGYVDSIARPGGNLTGINFLAAEVGAKRLELLRELVPAATRLAVLLDSTSPTAAAAMVREVEPAARAMGLQIHVVRVGTGREISAAFANFLRERSDALFVSPGAFVTNRRVQLVQLAARHAIPATYPLRDFAEIGGLMSYGASVNDAFRQIGVYAGRILKGAKIMDLPVVQSTKFELVINAETAKMLGLTVPHSLLSRADEVIE